MNIVKDSFCPQRVDKSVGKVKASPAVPRSSFIHFSSKQKSQRSPEGNVDGKE